MQFSILLVHMCMYIHTGSRRVCAAVYIHILYTFPWVGTCLGNLLSRQIEYTSIATA